MGRVEQKRHQAIRRKNRSSNSLNQGVKKHPVVRVHITSKHVSAQLSVPEKSTEVVATVTSASKVCKATNMTEKAVFAGQEMGKKLKEKKIKKVVLDRGSKLYHGRVATFADAVRESGIEV